MYSNREIQNRIRYKGDITVLLKKVCEDYQLGSFKQFTVIAIGYEDFNLRLVTSKGNYFVKIFSLFRDKKECKRYVDIIVKALAVGVSHPKIFSSSQGALYQYTKDDTEIYLCVMQYVDGRNVLQLPEELSEKDVAHIIEQAALINTIPLKPYPLYDSWAITNFLKEFSLKSDALKDNDKRLLSPFVQRFKELSIDTLPHSFVHGDLIATNVMKDTQGKIVVVDFAVANYYPRIQELAVLLCDLFFYPEDQKKTEEVYAMVLRSYQKYSPLTAQEVRTLPLYVQFAHAMHLLRANYEKVINKNKSSENEYYLYRGRKGLSINQMNIIR